MKQVPRVVSQLGSISRPSGFPFQRRCAGSSASSSGKNRSRNSNNKAPSRQPRPWVAPAAHVTDPRYGTPSSTQPDSTTTRKGSSGAASSLATMNNTELASVLLRGGRRNVAKMNLRESTAIIDEVATRVGTAPLTLVRDACHVAQKHGLFGHAVELFLRRKSLEGAIARQLKLPLNEAVVDSAFQLRRPEVLVEVATVAARDWAEWQSDLAELNVYRCFWRAAVAHFDCIGVDGANSAAAVAAHSALKQIHAIIAEHNPVVNSRWCSFNEMSQVAAQAIRYGADRDWGEMTFFSYCFEALLVPHRKMMLSGGVLTALMRTCRSGEGGKVVTVQPMAAYFDHMKLVPSNPKSPTSGFIPRAEGLDPSEEQGFHFFLQALLDDRQYSRVLRTYRAVVDSNPAYAPSASVLTVAVRAAGELRDHAFAVNGLDQILQAEPKATSFEVFMALAAVARCGAASFSKILEACVSTRAFEATEEELVFLMCQFAFNSDDPLPHTAAALEGIPPPPSAVGEKDPASDLLSPRVLHLVLQVHSLYHTDDFVAWFERYTDLKIAHEPRVFTYAVTWASRRSRAAKLEPELSSRLLSAWKKLEQLLRFDASAERRTIESLITGSANVANTPLLDLDGRQEYGMRAIGRHGKRFVEVPSVLPPDVLLGGPQSGAQLVAAYKSGMSLSKQHADGERSAAARVEGGVKALAIASSILRQSQVCVDVELEADINSSL